MRYKHFTDRTPSIKVIFPGIFFSDFRIGVLNLNSASDGRQIWVHDVVIEKK